MIPLPRADANPLATNGSDALGHSAPAPEPSLLLCAEPPPCIRSHVQRSLQTPPLPGVITLYCCVHCSILYL